VATSKVTVMTQPPPPPGWYPDPPGGQRYWDGSQWTDQRAPMRTPMPWWLVTILSLVFVFVVLMLFF
jgi:Protein of unknown function (DUF2510)